MDGEKLTVTFTSEGVTVEEERRAPLSDDPKHVTIDELDWGEFPINNLTMEVTGITPMISEEDASALKALEFEVDRLERSNGSEPSPAPDDFWARVREETGITMGDGTVSLSGDKNAKNNLVDFVRFLFEQGNLTKDDLPIKSGWKRYLIHTEPKDQEGGSMNQHVEVVDGVYLETKFSRDAIRKKIKELGERFGEA